MNQIRSGEKLNFFIDTGGTFTDALATNANGRIIARRKVLSSSSLRGTAELLNEKRLKVYLPFDDSPVDNFFRGCEVVFGAGRKHRCRILESIRNEVELEGVVPDEFNEGASFPIEIQSPEEAPVLAMRMIINTAMKSELPPLRLNLSTTRGTNALLERKGGRSVLLITEGFGDLLYIKNQQRPDLFSLNIIKPNPFASQIIEVPERLDSEGNVLRELDKNEMKRRLEDLHPDTESAGICLMHSYRNPLHEQKVASILKEMGISHVCCSSELSNSIKIVPRAVTTDINATLSPVMESYLHNIASVTGAESIRVMGSSGNLTEARKYTPKDGLLSGPAGGVIGAAAIGERNGFTHIISFDMGGTSTDVSRYDGEPDYIYEHSVGDATLASPAIEIETVAAGGGSVCGFDGSSLTVGPESAGADPGPACYGKGGPLTITDVNLLAGRLHPSNFHINIDPGASKKAFRQVMTRIPQADSSNPQDRIRILEGFLEIANERMAQAIRNISVQKGFDPSEYAMVAFGGAGAQHALDVAEKLNIRNVLVPSDAGLLSAFGLMRARPEEIVSKPVLKLLSESENDLPKQFETLQNSAVKRLEEQDLNRNEIEIVRQIVFMRLQGQDSSLEIEWDEDADLFEKFREAYKDQYGHWVEGREPETESIRVIAAASPEKHGSTEDFFDADREARSEPSPRFQTKLIAGGGELDCPVYDRQEVHPGSGISSPALILDPYSTTLILPGWKGTCRGDGTWAFVAETERERHAETDRSDEVNLQLYMNRFTSVAEQMGEMLRKTAISVNVKERLDFSCAVLDSEGYLVVNAPHIPVHLGAMGSCVRALMQEMDLGEGDVVVTNHPKFGGSHLPDVTVVSPVFVDGERIGFTASRAHHAEIGGKRPGSMPPDATRLTEEGVVIPPTYLLKDGQYLGNEIERLLREAKYPSRTTDENMADLQAAFAANHRGVSEMKKLIQIHGKQEVTGYMGRIRQYASERMRHTLSRLSDGTFEASEQLDDGSTLNVSFKIEGDTATVNFEGTSDVNPGNLNANPSIVRSVLIYVLRLLVNEPLPLNDGLFEPVTLHVPKSLLNPDFPDEPDKCPAVVGGNIETSQRLTDTLLKALNMAACSYGTMNNVLFGNNAFGYYETVAGGTGAGDGFDGADAVHQHMTNTRAADPEILEHRYPVLLRKYAIRKGSGGKGKWRGGDGIIRELEFTEPVSLSVLSQHRNVAPYGLKAGSNGSTGEHFVVLQGGKKIPLGWKDEAELQVGDRFILKTPGGGGFGKPDRS
ncbi:MAG: 5-oxoprolinase [Bacteroidetes bacterium]|jgi:5-oxoprolinase (ATP-hydrolysing)|nr:5-oxoprolinase [Bacteroidota bacterium]